MLSDAMSANAPTSVVVEKALVRLAWPDGRAAELRVGQSAGGWVLRWVGGTQSEPRAILESTTHDGGALLLWSQKEGGRCVAKPRPGAYDNPGSSTLYGGRTLEEVLASPRDVLSDEVMAGGEPCYERIAGLLPASGDSATRSWEARCHGARPSCGPTAA
jgi:hypothetical protein